MGTFFVASYVETVPAAPCQELGLADTRRARFDGDIDRDPAGGYRNYRAAIQAGEERAHVELTATGSAGTPPPFGSTAEHVRFQLLAPIPVSQEP